MSSTAASPPSSSLLVLMQPLLLILNRLLRQKPRAQETLRPFTGRVACFGLASMSVTSQVDAAGLVTTPMPDTGLTVTVAMPLVTVTGDYVTNGQAAVFEHVCAESEAEFTNILSTLLRNLYQDVAGDLSRMFNDVIVQRTVNDAQAAHAEATRVSRPLMEPVASYLTDEQPTLVRHAHPAQFAADVTALRGAEARLVKQLERLEKPS